MKNSVENIKKHFQEVTAKNRNNNCWTNFSKNYIWQQIIKARKKTFATFYDFFSFSFGGYGRNLNNLLNGQICFHQAGH